MAGIFSVFPAPSAQTFGPKYGPQVYTFIMLAAAACSIFNFLMVQNIESIQIQFYIGGFCAAMVMVINYFFEEELDLERLESKGLIVWEGENVD